MFKHLQRKLTYFCTAVTGALLIALTLLCLFVAEQNQTAGRYSAFVSEAALIQLHLQQQDNISLQWLGQLRADGSHALILYDNGRPLFSRRLDAPGEGPGDALARQAAETAKEDFALDLFSGGKSALPRHAEFPLTDASGRQYYVSAGTIPKDDTLLSFLLFYDLAEARRAMSAQRIAFAAADLCVLLLFAVFFFLLIGHMIRPIEENNRRQARFIAAASHELRTPLAVILSGTEALEKSGGAQPHFLSLIQQECRLMQRLLGDMLLLAGSDASGLSVSLSMRQPDELLLAAYEKYELLAAQKQIALSMRLPDAPLPDISCDGGRVLQILSILLDNALAYTPPGGSVTLSLELDGAGAQSVHRAIFRVTDTGCGILDEDKAHIFERFYRADRSRTDREHFGLGLCIAKELADAHRAKLVVADNPGGGACFSLVLKSRA